MGDRILENQGFMSGAYAGVTFLNTASTLATVTLTDVGFTKNASQRVWCNGELTMTMTVDNSVGQGTLDDIVISDTLDLTKFGFMQNTIEVVISAGGTSTTLVLDTDYSVAYTPSTETGLLVITFLAGGRANPIPVGSVVTVSFRGTKVAG